MKYLDLPVLTHLSEALSDLPTPEYRVQARVEAYSVKPIGKERKQFKEMEEAYVSGQEEMEEMSFSPEMREAGLSSAFGRLDEKESRKVHFLIVSLLNAAFPDHDFSALRPDHFTRERSAAQVLASVMTNFASASGNAAPQIVAQVAMSPAHKPTALPGIHQTMSSSLGSSPSGPPPSMANPDLYRLLSEVLPLEPNECEVYSWFPEPEYDPHLEADEDDMSEDGFDEEEENQYVEDSRADDMDLDVPGWGPGGMDLDDEPSSMAMARPSGSNSHRRSPLTAAADASFSSGSRDSLEKKKAGLLWSQHYFFYSRRMKRVLFMTCWARKRPSHVSSPPDDDSGAFPLAISSSFSSTGGLSGSASGPTRTPRSQRVNRQNQRSRKPKINYKLATSVDKGALSSTIPIRGMETPRPARLASSAPSAYVTPSPQVQQAALAKMSVGGFRPRQTPARVLLNAAAASNKVIDMTSSSSSASPITPAPKSGISAERVRKERSESTTPGPNHILSNMPGGSPGGLEPAGGKRVKV